jgi:magnesium transporter
LRGASSEREAPIIAKTLQPLAQTGISTEPGKPAQDGESWSGFAGSSAPAAELVALEIRADAPHAFIQRRLSKATLAARLRLPLRDLRVVDPAFRNEAPVVLARQGAIVIHLEHIRAVVEADRVTLFDPEQPAVEAFLPQLHARLATSNVRPTLPFELRALESILVDVCNSLMREMRYLSPVIESMLQALSSDGAVGPTASTAAAAAAAAAEHSSSIPPDALMLDRLLGAKNKLNELQNRATQLRSALNEVLMSDEDMSEMYLSTKVESGHRRRVDQHEEVEMMFENYLKQIDSMVSEVLSRAHAIQSTEDFVQIKLDALRNRILRLDLVLKLGSVSLSSGALVAAIFGMNLHSTLEDSELAFLSITGGLIGISGLVFLGGAAYCRYKRLL